MLSHKKSHVQLRRCGDFISKVVQIGTPHEIIALQRAKSAIQELLLSANQRIPPTANIYHLSQGEKLMDIDLGTIEVIEPEGSVCSLLMDEGKVFQSNFNPEAVAVVRGDRINDENFFFNFFSNFQFLSLIISKTS